MNRMLEHAGAASVPSSGSFPPPAERMRGLLFHATQAPSRCNSQPWLFEIEGAEVRIYGDLSRRLSFADPSGRELAMACGAACMNLEVAARQGGHAVSVEITDGSRHDGLLARVALKERLPPTPDEEKLFSAIPARRTEGFTFEERDVPSGIVTALVREAAAERATLRVVEQGARAVVGELVAEAHCVQRSDPGFRAECAAWSRSTDSDMLDVAPRGARDDFDRSSVLHRLLARLRGGSAAEERHDALHARALLALFTRRDTVEDWLWAGRAVQRALLRAATLGLGASSFDAVIEVPHTRKRLRQALGERGYPQLLVRLGFGRPTGAAPRRRVDTVLRSALARR